MRKAEAARRRRQAYVEEVAGGCRSVNEGLNADSGDCKNRDEIMANNQPVLQALAAHQSC